MDPVSPSLAPRDAGPAYELKFVVPEPVAARVESWAAGLLVPDPHGDETGAYRITTLYLDTADLAVYRRGAGFRRRKFRIRRYGLMSLVFLERKTKAGDRVAKRRQSVAEQDLARLSAPAPEEGDWPGHWFHARTRLKHLAPAALVSYTRRAFIGDSPEGPLRVTLDREVRGEPAVQWGLAREWHDRGGGEVHGGRSTVLPGQVIVELKFRNALPRPFKRLIGELRLCPGPVSKYRLCREAWARGAADRETARA